MSRLEEIEARWATATPGPWVVDIDTGRYLGGSAHYWIRTVVGDPQAPWSKRLIGWLAGGHGDADVVERRSEALRPDAEARADAEAIAAAPEDVAWLIGALTEARDVARHLYTVAERTTPDAHDRQWAAEVRRQSIDAIRKWSEGTR